SFLKIVSRTIFLRGIIGPDYTGTIMGSIYWEKGIIPAFVGIIGISIVGYVFWKAEIQMKLFILFAFMVFAGALASPQVSLNKPQWEVMAGGGGGGRYWFLPGLGWIVSLGWLFLNAKQKFLKNFAGTLLLCLI